MVGPVTDPAIQRDDSIFSYTLATDFLVIITTQKLIHHRVGVAGRVFFANAIECFGGGVDAVVRPCLAVARMSVGKWAWRRRPKGKRR